MTHPTPEPAGPVRGAADAGLLAWIRDYAQPETAAMSDEQALTFARQVQADHLGYTAEALDGPGAATAAGPDTPPRSGDSVRVLYDDGTDARGVWALDDDGVPGVRDDGGVRALDPGAGVVGWQVVGPDGGQALLRHPDADDPDYQPHPQELSDAHDRGDGVPAGLTYSQYVAWRTGPGLAADVLDAAAAEHDQTMTVLDWWDTHDAVLADLAEPARTHHPDLTAGMDDEQAATWHAHHDPAGVPALVEPAHLHAAIDNARETEADHLAWAHDHLADQARAERALFRADQARAEQVAAERTGPDPVLRDEASLVPADALEHFLGDPGDGFGLDA